MALLFLPVCSFYFDYALFFLVGLFTFISLVLFFLPVLHSIPFSLFNNIFFILLFIYFWWVREMKPWVNVCCWTCPGAQNLRQTHRGMAKLTDEQVATQKYKKHENQGKRILPKGCRINIVKMTVIESDYRFNSVDQKFSAIFQIKREKILSLLWKYKRSWRAKVVLRRKCWINMIPHLKLYFRTILATRTRCSADM